MDRWRGRVALVTGAGSGIGAAIALELLKNGLKVVGCDKDTGLLYNNKDYSQFTLSKDGQCSGHNGLGLSPAPDATKPCTSSSDSDHHGVLHPYTCDLRNEEEILSMFQYVQDVLGGVDICVNVAGISHNAPLLTGKTAEWRDMMDVNVIAYCVCTREAVSQMRQNEVDDGQIIMINSICGYKVINAKQHHFYTATKHAITALIEGVKNELQEMKSKIRISSVSPEIVKTNFLYTMHKPHGTTHIADAIYKNVDYMEPKDVADACLFILSTPRHVQVHDILMKPV